MKKIIFILSAIDAVYAIKRVNEFIENGYIVEVYGFNRENEPSKYLEVKYNYKFNINVIGSFTNDVSYIKRLPIIIKGLKKVIKRVSLNDVVYVFGLNLAVFMRFCPNITYIYEEADLTYTYFNNKFVRNIFKKIDRSVILNSLETVLTSDGFIDYLFDNKYNRIPPNISIIPNKLSPEVSNFVVKTSKQLNINKIRFGFVGGIRFISIYNFVKVIAERFPNHEVLLYGIFSHSLKNKFEKLIENNSNIKYMGRFKNPDDLLEIYSNIDISIGTYDVTSDNVKFAEPNKLYESIYFGVPIIVSSGTFLNKKVSQLGIGYGINALHEDSIYSFINAINKEQIDKWGKSINLIDKRGCININTSFFKKINDKLK